MEAPPPQTDLGQILFLDPIIQASGAAHEGGARTFTKPKEFHCLVTFEAFADEEAGNDDSAKPAADGGDEGDGKQGDEKATGAGVKEASDDDSAQLAVDSGDEGDGKQGDEKATGAAMKEVSDGDWTAPTAEPAVEPAVVATGQLGFLAVYPGAAPEATPPRDGEQPPTAAESSENITTPLRNAAESQQDLNTLP